MTLIDAGNYITKLPQADHTAPEWQAAMEALMLVATLGGPTMFARIGVVRALNRHVERVFNPDRKDKPWAKRKLKRDELRLRSVSSPQQLFCSFVGTAFLIRHPRSQFKSPIPGADGAFSKARF
jgi:hypothetical protein